MNSEVLINWVNDVNRTIIGEGIKILLIVDKYLVYLYVERLEAVEVVFLPLKIIIH